MSSSVKWLIDELTFESEEGERLNSFQEWVDVKEHCEKAKEMHKKESISFALHYTFGHQEVSDQIKGNLEKLYNQYFEGDK
jgi:hypothetical protein